MKEVKHFCTKGSKVVFIDDTILFALSRPRTFLRNRIKDYRLKKCYSQQLLADLVGCSRNAIASFENNVYQPTAYYCFLLCHALDVSFDSLFYLEA